MNTRITYCTSWNYKPEADRVSAEMESITGVSAQLEAGSGGVFNVFFGDDLVFSKSECQRFPHPGEIAAKIKALLEHPKH